MKTMKSKEKQAFVAILALACLKQTQSQPTVRRPSCPSPSADGAALGGSVQGMMEVCGAGVAASGAAGPSAGPGDPEWIPRVRELR